MAYSQALLVFVTLLCRRLHVSERDTLPRVRCAMCVRQAMEGTCSQLKEASEASGPVLWKRPDWPGKNHSRGVLRHFRPKTVVHASFHLARGLDDETMQAGAYK